jgi:hypothetical protein
MARAARVIGDGGVIGWLQPENGVAFNDEGQPTLATMQLAYQGSDIPQVSFSFSWLTTSTQAEARSQAKDAIRQNIIDTTGVTIPKANIRMLNAPE